MSYIVNGKVVHSKPLTSQDPLSFVTSVFWSVANLVGVFFESCFRSTSDKKKLSSSGGVVKTGGKWSKDAANAIFKDKAPKNVSSVKDFKDAPCAAGA